MSLVFVFVFPYLKVCSYYYLQLGIAIGFLFPPMLVPNSSDPSVIGHGLQTMFYTVAAFTTIILILILVCT